MGWCGSAAADEEGDCGTRRAEVSAEAERGVFDPARHAAFAVACPGDPQAAEAGLFAATHFLASGDRDAFDRLRREVDRLPSAAELRLGLLLIAAEDSASRGDWTQVLGTLRAEVPDVSPDGAANRLALMAQAYLQLGNRKRAALSCDAAESKLAEVRPIEDTEAPFSNWFERSAHERTARVALGQVEIALRCVAPAAVPLPAFQKLKDPTKAQNTWVRTEILRHHDLERDCADHIAGLYRHLPPETQRDALNAAVAIFDEQMVRLRGAMATMRFGPRMDFRSMAPTPFESILDYYFRSRADFSKRCLHITELSGVGGCQVRRPQLWHAVKGRTDFEVPLEIVPGPGWTPLYRTSEAAPVQLEPPLQSPLPHLE
jgi:hypothetical protein